jgi:integrase
MEQLRQAEVYGVRPKRTFRQAATKYLEESTKATIRDAALVLKHLDPFIGDSVLDKVNMGSLQSFIQKRKADGVKNRTINYALQTVRHILNLAVSEWFNEYGQTWLAFAPKIKLLKQDDQREPYPLSWDEQLRLFNALPPYLAQMALFKVNTGCREQEVCQLRWDWEQEIPQLETSVFIIPKERVKNREDRLVVLNRVAQAVINDRRGLHPEFVFTTMAGKQVKRINKGSWRRAREKVGLPLVRVHDLKHTC